MTCYLLDVNVLIARADPNHSLHGPVKSWLGSIARQLIATCPIVENGFVRIFGHPNYPGGPGSIDCAIRHLEAIRRLPNHRFIGDDLSLDAPNLFHSFDNISSRDLTDVYLLALAANKGIQFATFDQNIDPSSVVGGVDSLTVILCE